jgi:hypothetical protein
MTVKKIENCEVTTQASLPVAKSLIPKKPKAPPIIHGPLGLKYFLKEKTNAIVESVENQFTPHDLSDENQEQ